MKKIIAAVLTVSLIVGASTVAYAQPNTKASKGVTASTSIQRGSEKKTTVQKAAVKKDNGLIKSKEELIKKCVEMIAQINKLRGYIIGTDGKFLVEFKDLTTGNAELKSIDEAIKKVEDFNARIKVATTSQELKSISKELQNNWMKHQTIIKRITGLTSAARLYAAYKETEDFVKKLGIGLDGIATITGSSINLDVEALKKDHAEIVVNLEKAHDDYLVAVAMFSSITDSSKADKTFKAAQAQLMKAKDELHDVLSQAKKLLVNIKTSVHKQLDVIVKPDDDDKNVSGAAITTDDDDENDND